MQIDREEKQFFSIAIGIFLGGVAIAWTTHYLPQQYEIRRSVLLSIGESLMVASILAVTVDLYIKKGLVRTVTKNLFQYLVGYKLPEPIQNRLRDLMGTSIIRRNYQA